MKKIRLKKKFYFRNMILLCVCIISFIISYNIKLYSSNEEFIMNLLNDSNYYKKYEDKNIIKKINNYLYNVNLNEPVTLLENMFNYESTSEYYPEVLETITKHINDPTNDVIDNPIVYIYNSHQLENYDSSNYEPYNITPNVMMASYLLKEKLNNYNIPTIVEEGNINEFIKINNWDYNYSYIASRYFIEEAKRKYPSIKYFIDIHRDSVTKEYSTAIINDMSYAKVLFVVGLDHDNYKGNLDFANNVNNRLINGISKGIIKKSGPNVNGIYNQDISSNALLIEVGGYQNKIDEVYNTIDVLANTLKEVINEN
ncbi:MAG: stage II sporulation protein P [Tenericutes bacterium]|nr:stage II sporulation protein P [Mycoplasmatota bacterium]